jgi:uncharacterized surface protein with fasciclin (FAS1) repeats
MRPATKRNVMKKLIIAAAAATALLASAQALAQAPAAGSKDIVETAVAAGQFTTLAKALQAAGLVETLKGPGPFTVFAPTDAAFAKLPAGTVENLLKPENRAQLTSILTFHVVPARATASAVSGKVSDVATVQGGKLKVDGTNGVRVNNANVIQPDVMASNGVIHVIDTVLIPGAQ